MTQSAHGVAAVEDELDRLSEFVGRLYLLLITVVFAVKNWRVFRRARNAAGWAWMKIRGG